MKIRREIEALLAETGLAWSLQDGAKHIKIILAGRLAGILPRCGRSNTQRAMLNTRAQIKRIAREMSAHA